MATLLSIMFTFLSHNPKDRFSYYIELVALSFGRWYDRLISYGVSLFLYTLRYYGIGVTERLVQCCVPREIHWYATRTERWCDKGILIHTVLGVCRVISF